VKSISFQAKKRFEKANS